MSAARFGRAHPARLLPALLIAALLIIPGVPAFAQDDEAEANTAVVMQLVDEVINQGNLDVVGEIYAPGYVEHANADETTYDTIEAVQESFSGLFENLTDPQVQVDDVIATGDRVVARYTLTANEGQVDYTGIFIARLEDGKIVESWENFDLVSLLTQIGVMPPMEMPASEPVTVTEGLNGPMGVLVDPDGGLWVVDSGFGGDTEMEVTDPETGEPATVKIGETSRIIHVAPDGTQTEVAALPSVLIGEEASGGNRLALLDGTLYATSNGWQEGIADERVPGMAVIVAVGDDGVTEITNTWDFEEANNPDGYVLETHPYGLAAGPDGLLYIADAGANNLLTVDPASGEVSLVAVIGGIPGPLPNGARGDAMEMDPVPTGVVVDEDGTAYVSLLTGFPFVPGSAKVVMVTPEGEVSDYATGLTMPTDLRLGPDGNLYAVQIGVFSEQGPIPNSGSVVRVQEGDGSEVVLSNLSFPTSLDFTADGDAYVTINGAGAPGTGAVVEVAGLTNATGTPVADALAALTASQPAPLPEAAVGPEIPQDKGYLVEDLGNGLYVVGDGSYQAAFLTTGEGVIVFDAPPNLGQKLLDAIAETTDEPITHVVYSHAHADHIGAAGLLPADATYIAQEETAAQLAEDGADDPDRELPFGLFVGGGPVPLPTETFTDSYTLEVGDQVVELEYHGNNHTTGNTFIYFPDQKALMVVDIVDPGWVPFVDLSFAEDIDGFMQAHEDALGYDFDTLIAGHLNRLGTRADVETQLEYVQDVRANAVAALQSVDFMSIASEVGFTDQWKLFGTYLDTVAQTCADATLDTWGDQLGGAEAFVKSHCAAMVKYLRVH